jgi:hypothetical protein
MKTEDKGKEEEFFRVRFKRIANEAKRLLLDKKYSEELRRPTDKDYEYAAIIAASLHELAPYESADRGPTLDELTLSLFQDFWKRDPDTISDEEYEPKKAQIIRSINLLKKIALERLAKEFTEAYENPKVTEDECLRVPFYIGCKYSQEIGADVYFDCLAKTSDQKIRIEAIQQFFKTLGFEDIQLTQPGYYKLTGKGGGLVRLPDVDLPELPSIPDYGIEEVQDILENLKGDYTSERGLDEFMDLVDHALSLDKTEEDNFTLVDLMHTLIPESVNATGAQLDMYRTKIDDVLYFIHRMQNPSVKFIEAAKEEYKRTRRLETVKFIKNDYPKEDNKIRIIEVTYEKSNKNELVTSFSQAAVYRCPRVVKARKPGDEPFVVDYMTLEGLERVAKKENYNLFKHEPNYIEYRKYEPEDEYGAHDTCILSAPITQDNTIVEWTDNTITEDAEEVELTLKDFEEEFIEKKGYVRVK